MNPWSVPTPPAQPRVSLAPVTPLGSASACSWCSISAHSHSPNTAGISLISEGEARWGVQGLSAIQGWQRQLKLGGRLGQVAAEGDTEVPTPTIGGVGLVTLERAHPDGVT